MARLLTLLARRATSASVAAPTNSVAPAVSGTPEVGQTLTTTDGTWTGSPAFTYQWKRNGVSIGGATVSTYALVTADAGAAITATVTGTNAGGSASATSAATAVVAPAGTATLRAYVAGDVPPGLFPWHLAGQDTALHGPPPQEAAFI